METSVCVLVAWFGDDDDDDDDEKPSEEEGKSSKSHEHNFITFASIHKSCAKKHTNESVGRRRRWKGKNQYLRSSFH
jgi:hypothetical protein